MAPTSKVVVTQLSDTRQEEGYRGKKKTSQNTEKEVTITPGQGVEAKN